MAKFLLVMLMTFTGSIALTQNTPDLVKRYNGAANKNDALRAMTTDQNGNIYVTGHTDTRNNGLDYVTIKYNAGGQQVWASTYNGSGNAEDWANAIAVDASGNVFVTGRSTGLGTNLDYATIKYSAAGVQLWERRHNSPSNRIDIAKDVKVDALGNVYVTGFSDGASQFNGNRITTIKYNVAGDSVWQRNYDVAANVYDNSFHGREEGQSLAVDPAGNCYVTGVSITTSQQMKAITLKYDPSGTLVWNTVGLGDQGRKIIIGNDGHILTANWGGVTSKYNAETGEVIWDVIAPGVPGYYDMACDLSGNVYVTGPGRINSSSDDYLTVKYNNDGVQQWLKTYNGSNNGIDIPRSIAVDNNGHVYVTGRTEIKSGRTVSVNIATLKYDGQGNQIGSTLLYDGPEKKGSEAFGVCVDVSGNAWISGTVTGKNTDCLTIRYAASAARSLVDKEILQLTPSVQLENYPNPFNTSTSIVFQTNEAGRVDLAVFDQNGKFLSSLVHGYRQAGTHRITYNPIALNPGNYILQLKIGNITKQKSMIVMR